MGALQGEGFLQRAGDRNVSAAGWRCKSFGFWAESATELGILATISLLEVLGDILALGDLAARQDDPARRRSLNDIRAHVARRYRGAKVSEAATVLGLSQPTVRAWIGSGLLGTVAGSKPVRIDVLALAETKRALDLVREHADDRPLLVAVMRVLRDRAALVDAEEGFDDLRVGRVMPLGDDLLDEIAGLRRERTPRPKSR